MIILHFFSRSLQRRLGALVVALLLLSLLQVSSVWLLVRQQGIDTLVVNVMTSSQASADMAQALQALTAQFQLN